MTDMRVVELIEGVPFKRIDKPIAACHQGKEHGYAQNNSFGGRIHRDDGAGHNRCGWTS
jgi:hypothetical protein